MPFWSTVIQKILLSSLPVIFHIVKCSGHFSSFLMPLTFYLSCIQQLANSVDSTFRIYLLITSFLKLHCYDPGPGCYSCPGLLQMSPNWSPDFLPGFSSVFSWHSSWCKGVKNISQIISFISRCSSGFQSHLD